MRTAQSASGGRQGFENLRGRMIRIIPELLRNRPIHHWRYPIGRFSGEATDASNLYWTSGRPVHTQFHKAFGSFSRMVWGGAREVQTMFEFWTSGR
jgi:hypothetical protein